VEKQWPANIVLADDDADDRALFGEALRQVAPSGELTLAANGVELMALLERQVPDLLFLDINMPLKNGIDCIKWIRELRQLRRLIVIAYSSAFDDVQINKAYAFGVHLYLIKPTRLRYLVDDLQAMLDLDWDDPTGVTFQHFERGHYSAFNAIRG
jgi:CheY-like chemotaxis protein